MVFGNFHPATTFRDFGARKSFGYLGLCTARDLFISGVYDQLFGPMGYPTCAPRHQVEGKKQVVDSTQFAYT